MSCGQRLRGSLRRAPLVPAPPQGHEGKVKAVVAETEHTEVESEHADVQAEPASEEPVAGRWEMSPTTLIVGSLIIFAAVTVLVLALPLII